MKRSSRYFFQLMAVVGYLFFVYFMGVNNLKSNLLTRDENSTLHYIFYDDGTPVIRTSHKIIPDFGRLRR